MIVQENISDTLVRTYSDIGMMIRGGVPEGLYEEAIDPISMHRTYVETEIPIPDEEAEIEDYEEALREVGVDI
jgi:hypothetical protein